MVNRTWFVQEVYTPDDAENDRRRKYAEFQYSEKPGVSELAVAGMVAIGWDQNVAERKIKDDAVLDGTEIEDGMLSFIVFGNNGEYGVTIQTEPFPTPAAYVVMVRGGCHNGQPVAVRNYQLPPSELEQIAGKLRLPVEFFSVVKVLDIDG